MNNLYYCVNCHRVVPHDGTCSYCSNEGTKELVVGAPVNVIGSKLKGNVLKVMDGSVRLVIKDESNHKYVREYEAEKIRKIL